MSDSHPYDASLFPTIARDESLASRVASHLQQLILESKLQQGGRLPSERFLAEQFGVSRTVVREAVHTLVAKGLLEVQAGSGIAVRAEPLSSVSQSLSLLLSLGLSTGQLDLAKIVEVRRMLEVEIAGIAAERATPDDVARLEAILEEAAQDPEDEECFVRTDVAFHAGLARATQNELFIVLLTSISDLLVEIRRLGWSASGTSERALRHHRLILESVAGRDAEKARGAMNSHMDEARDTMARGLEQLTAE